MAPIVTLKQLIGYATAMAVAMVVIFALPACSPLQLALSNSMITNSVSPTLYHVNRYPIQQRFRNKFQLLENYV